LHTFDQQRFPLTGISHAFLVPSTAALCLQLIFKALQVSTTYIHLKPATVLAAVLVCHSVPHFVPAVQIVSKSCHKSSFIAVGAGMMYPVRALFDTK
jgi:hypothetical protein